MKPWLRYFLISVLFFIIVDFLTTEALVHPVKYYSTFMPLILVFYIGYPLIFSFILTKFKLKTRGLFIGAIIGMLISEILFFHNPLFFQFPLVFIALLFGISCYSLITIVPKWIVDKELSKRKKWLIIMLILLIIHTLLNYATQIKT